MTNNITIVIWTLDKTTTLLLELSILVTGMIHNVFGSTQHIRTKNKDLYEKIE